MPAAVRDSPSWNPEGFIASARQKKGRAIYACGWEGLKKDMRVGKLLVHVGGAAPLQVQQFDSSPELIERDRYAIRSFLLSCAVDVAKALESELQIDNGWLEWRVAEKLAQDVAATAPGFVIVRKRKRRRLRGTDVILRREA